MPDGGVLVVEIRPKRGVLDFAGIAAAAAPRVQATAEHLDELIRRGVAEASMARATRPFRGSRRAE